MQSITDQIITVFCFIDDFLKANPSIATWRASNNAHPGFCDAEVITIALLQGSFGCAHLKRAFLLVQNNWCHLFPKLPSYQQWLARLHRLSPLIGRLIQQALPPLLPTAAVEDRLFLIDSKPVAVCKPIRHGRVRLLREDGAYFGKNQAGWYFGYKLHVLCHHGGAILCAFLTAGNVADREVAPALAEATDGGIALADFGYVDARELEPLLWEEHGLLLVTPFHAGKTDKQEGTHARALVSSVRERIETCFSGLWDRFVDRVFSRSWEGLWNTIKLKMLHYNLCKAGILDA
jgi:hypothetical protein